MRKFGFLIIGLTMLLPVLPVLSNEQPKAQADSSGEPLKLALSQEERSAIVKDANYAYRQYVGMDVKERKGDEIPQRFWGEAILKLKPVRVLNDRVNVAIVLRDDEHSEQGLYVNLPISSVAAGHGKKFVLWEKLSKPEDKSFGELYLYSIEKPKNSKPSKDSKAS
jgi:hypothetical protein